jgi:amidohydrolase
METLKKAVIAIKNELIDHRRLFHQFPELGMQEFRTSKTIADYLENLGITVTKNVGKTGVVGILNGKYPGKTLLIRADMDALTLDDKKEVPYRSKNKGIMHACGHDGHMAILLGCAKILKENKDRLYGQIKLVFQPAEEMGIGAKAMIKDDVLNNPKVDAALALHLISTKPVKTIYTKSGPLMAGADTFFIDIGGKSGHAGMPYDSIDAVYIASLVITDLQTQIRKQFSPFTPIVIHIGKINGGDAENIVADKVKMVGTLRTMDQNIRDQIQRKMDQTLAGITSSMGGTYDLSFEDSSSPPLINDKALTTLVRKAAEKAIGKTSVLDAEPVMGGEDFSFFSDRVPGCMFFVGAGDPLAKNRMPLHSAHFDIDEEALVTGTEVMVQSALDYLSK